MLKKGLRRPEREAGGAAPRLFFYTLQLALENQQLFLRKKNQARTTAKRQVVLVQVLR